MPSSRSRWSGCCARSCSHLRGPGVSRRLGSKLRNAYWKRLSVTLASTQRESCQGLGEERMGEEEEEREDAGDEDEERADAANPIEKGCTANKEATRAGM